MGQARGVRDSVLGLCTRSRGLATLDGAAARVARFAARAFFWPEKLCGMLGEGGMNGGLAMAGVRTELTTLNNAAVLQIDDGCFVYTSKDSVGAGEGSASPGWPKRARGVPPICRGPCGAGEPAQNKGTRLEWERRL